MCISCGCGEPNDDHGDSRNITLDDLNQAAAAAGTTRDRVLQNMMVASVEKATRKTLTEPMVLARRHRKRPMRRRRARRNPLITARKPIRSYPPTSRAPSRASPANS